MGDEDATDATELARALVDESPDALIALTPDGRVLFWNLGARSIFGFSSEESVGRLLEELIIPEQHTVEARRALAQVIEGNLPPFETVRRTKSGALVHVDVSMRAVRQPSGQVRFIVANKKDVTLVKRLRDERAAELR
jgi:PAS domain S-box-containing protein